MANLRISELDFDAIKTNLKDFLKDQNEFTDYDFEGSGLSILIDILAYNTHYNAYLANMLANEMFLDSAVKRSSAVSIAKHLGYTSRSIKSAVATIDIEVSNPIGFPTLLSLDAFTTFTTTLSGQSYTFRNIEPYITTPVNGVYKFSNVKVYEGYYLEYLYTVVNPGPDEKYVIPNFDVDVTTLIVTVQQSATNLTTDTYFLATDLTDVKSTSQIYYLEENSAGKYEIFFGDGVLGKKLSAGNIITIRYLVSSGPKANVSGKISQFFIAQQLIGGSSQVNVTTVTNSTGGADKESISSIKFNAPSAFLTRNRAVTKNDYISLIKAKYPLVEAISVWGGEDNIPPRYGKVFISLKPYSGYIIDEETKNFITNDVLKERQVLTVSPVYIDPDFIYVNLEVTLNYLKDKTLLTPSQFKVLINNTILNYFSTELQQFQAPFYYSQLLNKLSNIDTSVENVLVNMKLQKRIVPALNVSNGYLEDSSLKFNNRITPGDLQSTRFYIVQDGVTIPARINDLPNTMPPDPEGTGVVRLYNADTSADIGAIGTINYRTGEVSIQSIVPVGYPTGQFDIRLTVGVQENSYNILTSRNQIIVYDDSVESTVTNQIPGITINALPL